MEESLGAREARAVRHFQSVLTHRSRELNVLAPTNPSDLCAVHHDTKLHGSSSVARRETPHTNYARHSDLSDNRLTRDGGQGVVTTVRLGQDGLGRGLARPYVSAER